MKDSPIQWTDHTFNAWTGCTKVSPACAHCYAETLAKRNTKTFGQWGKGQPRKQTSAAYWKQPLQWNRQAEIRMQRAADDSAEDPAVPTGYHRPRVFCASMADWLDDEVPVEWLADLLTLIHRTPNLDWLLLTKRPGLWKLRVLMAGLHLAGYRDGQTGSAPAAPSADEDLVEAVLGWSKGESTMPNVWLGCTVENQKMADLRIPELLQIPATIRFLSMEPLLGPVDLPFIEGCRSCNHPGDIVMSINEAGRCSRCNGTRQESQPINWIITGGESGPKARPSHPDWFRSLRDQCAAAGVAFFFKQWGEWCPASEEFGVDGSVMPDSGIMPCGKRAVWIAQDGHTQFPSAKGLDNPFAIARMGTKHTGNLLDGVHHLNFPQP